MTVAVDAVADLVGFARRLRADGLAVDPTRVAMALRALGAYQPLGYEDIYWATRLTMCSQRDDLPTFDAAYLAWFGVAPPAMTLSPALLAADAPAAAWLPGTGPAEQAEAASTRAGLAERLAVPAPWTLTEADRAETARFVRAFTGAMPLRTTMRRVPGGRTSVDVARTARVMLRSGGEPVRLWYRRRSYVLRRLVLLLDVSESMRAHRPLLLRFAYAAVAAAPGMTEVFTIGTRLDRITSELRRRDPQAAMDALAGKRSDWDGGTHLGATVTRLVREWGGSRAVRSANAVIVSDGWELADPTPLVRSVARLSRLAHRVIWADPASRDTGYAPEAPGLVASLPYVRLVAGHEAEALRSLAGTLGVSACGPAAPIINTSGNGAFQRDRDPR